jgi:hypothetical protein
MLKALGIHFKNWLNSLSLIQTALLLVGAFGGAWLVGEITHAFANVTGHWLWIEGIGAFLLFASSFVSVQQRDIAKHPPVPPVVQQTAPVRPTANVAKLPPRVTGVLVNPQYDVFQEAMPGTGEPAVLAEYENTPLVERQIGSINGVGALVIYSDENGQEVHELRVQAGCWLGANGDVNFPPRTKHQLLLALKTHDRVLVIHGGPRDAIPSPIRHNRLNIEVRLGTNQGQPVRTDRYVLIATNEEFDNTGAVRFLV